MAVCLILKRNKCMTQVRLITMETRVLALEEEWVEELTQQRSFKCSLEEVEEGWVEWVVWAVWEEWEAAAEEAAKEASIISVVEAGVLKVIASGLADCFMLL